MCDSATPSNGGIEIVWSFTHTGGGDLTSLEVTYIFRQGGNNKTLMGPMVDLDSTSATIPSLVAGFSYVPIVKAENTQGSVMVECPQVDLNVGKCVVRESKFRSQADCSDTPVSGRAPHVHIALYQ